MEKAVILGTFDGIHRGHTAVIDSVSDYEITAVTFQKPPKFYFGSSSGLLMLPEDKRSALKTLGVKNICELDFLKVKKIRAKDFLEKINSEFLPSAIACGFNFRFGKNAEGDTSLLQDYCLKNNIKALVSEPKKTEGEIISSSIIREMVKRGKIDKANNLLFMPFSFSGEVIKGNQIGEKLGFPTANQIFPSALVTPLFGAYKSEVKIDDKIYSGISNVGVKPTVGSDRVLCETYIKDFSGDIYGKNIRVSLKKFIREERRFSSLSELKIQVKKDLTE